MDQRLASFYADVESYSTRNEVAVHLSEKEWFFKDTWYRDLCSEVNQIKANKGLPVNEVVELIVKTLYKVNAADITSFLNFYDLPLPSFLNELPRMTFGNLSARFEKFRIRTLPVDEEDIDDGDGFMVNSVVKDFSYLPGGVLSTMKVFKDRNNAEVEEGINPVSSLYKVIKLGRKWVWTQRFHIRLRGIDAPEMSQQYGSRAKAALVELIKGKKLLLDVVSIDEHRRYIADAYFDNQYLQERLLSNGVAVQHQLFDTSQWFKTLEKTAADGVRGLWGDIKHKYDTKPWLYKAEQKRATNHARRSFDYA